MLFGVPTMYHRLADAAEEDAEVAAGLRGRAAAGLGLGAPPRPRVRADRARHRASGSLERYGLTETLMNMRGPRRRRAAAGVRRAAAWPGVELRLLDDDGAELDASRRRDDRRGGGARPQPVPRLSEPPRRDGRGLPRRLVPHRRSRDPRARRLLADRGPPLHRPDQDRRLQGGRRRGGGRAARAPGRGRGGRDRRARRRPGRAHRGVGGRRRAGEPPGADASSSTTSPPSSRPTSARARCASWRSCRATRWARWSSRGWATAVAGRAAADLRQPGGGGLPRARRVAGERAGRAPSHGHRGAAAAARRAGPPRACGRSSSWRRSTASSTPRRCARSPAAGTRWASTGGATSAGARWRPTREAELLAPGPRRVRGAGHRGRRGSGRPAARSRRPRPRCCARPALTGAPRRAAPRGSATACATGPSAGSSWTSSGRELPPPERAQRLLSELEGAARPSATRC